MTHQSPIVYAPGTADAGAQVAQLRDALGLVEQIAGIARDGDSALDENALVSSAYAAAEPIVQKRFDALATETSDWAAVAVEALLLCDNEQASKAAAATLASELAQALQQLDRVIRLTPGAPPEEVRLPSWMDVPPPRAIPSP